MAERPTVLSVNNLVINFKTDNGLVQAVRDVSFDVYEGEVPGRNLWKKEGV